MRRYFYAALAVILLSAVSIVAWGAYLNRAGEETIAARLEGRVLVLSGAVAMRRPMCPVLRWDAVSLYSEHMADVVARVDGIVADAFVSRAQRVTEGEPLMRISNEDISLQIMRTEGSIKKAEAERNRAKKTYERYKTLAAQNAASRQQLDESEAYYLAAEASIEELTAELRANLVMKSRQTVVSPIDGEVLMIYKQPGTFVSSGTPVCLIGDFSSLMFKTSLSDRRVRQLLPLDVPKQLMFHRADFTKAYGTEYGAGNTGEQQSFTAYISSVQPELDIQADIRNVTFVVDNSSGMLEPQTYRSMIIQSLTAHDVLAVPLAAVTDTRDTVFVKGDDGLIRVRSVVTGEDDGEYIEVLSGLAEGEIVVTSDAKGLKDGLRADIDLERGE